MLNYPLIVIGAGAGGLVVAIGAAKAGKKVLLIEQGNYGGDCTNFGCIPSKSLIASASCAHALDKSRELGVQFTTSQRNCDQALTFCRQIVASIREHEEPEALVKYGVETLTGRASFQTPHRLQVIQKNGNAVLIEGKQIVIATGSHPHIPSIAGLQTVPYFTNETIFQLESIPEHLAILGGGPVGCELAQAFHRLGSKVTIIQHDDHLLKKEEPESQRTIEEVFQKEGISVFLNSELSAIKEEKGKIILTFQKDKSQIEVSHLLVAAGRKPNLEALNLTAAHVATNTKRVIVDHYGKTSQKHIWAVGDVTSKALFTHVAEHEARCVLFNLLFPWPFRKSIQTLIPRVTFTDPEIASLGFTEKEALERYGEHRLAIYTVPFSQLDRAITARRTEGFIKIITKKWSSRILGASIVGPHAGEMIMEIALAIKHRIPLRKLADVIHPYPTYSLAIRKAADLWLSQTILSLFKREPKR